MSNFCTVYGLRVFKFLEGLMMKKLKSKCLLASMKFHTKSENHYSQSPFSETLHLRFLP
jgi:hypothetical protein